MRIENVLLKDLRPLLRRSFPAHIRLGLEIVAPFAPGMIYRGARVGGDLAGGLVGRKGRRYWELVSVMVLPEFRRLGVAQELVRRYLAEAGSSEVVAFIRKSNRPSRMLAASFGFRRARIWSFPFCFEEILPWGEHYLWRNERHTCV